MANVKIEFEASAWDWLLSGPETQALLAEEASKVQAEMEATASSAENGPGGTLDGYAAAGFTADVEARGKRSRAVVRSNADPGLALRVHFHTQRRDGVAHLRAALYKFIGGF